MKFFYVALGALSVLAGSALADGVPPASNGDFSEAPCAYAGGPKTAGGAPTLVSYVGTTKGTLTDISVLQSSGDPAQDAAVVSCVRERHFDPSTALGKLVLGRHRLNFGWDTVNGQPVLHRIGIGHVCTQDYPLELAKAGIGGKAVVQFTITADGRVRDSSIAESTGNALLDTASLTCVQNWRYRPATKDGQPIAVPWKAEIVWRAPPPPDESLSLPAPIVN